MKVIDLLNKIANGEEVPKKLRLKDKLYKDLYYQYNERYNCYDLLGKNLKAGCYVFGYSELNDELEIIEDTPEKNKRIDKLKKNEILLTNHYRFIICVLNIKKMSHLQRHCGLIYWMIIEEM